MVATILVWLCSILLAVAFTRAGLDKFSPHGGFAPMFARWGYPPWFRIAVGAGEIAAVVLLLWPRFARVGALTVLIVMFGAMATRLWHGEASRIPSAELLPALLAIAVIVLRGRLDRRQVAE